MSVKRNIAMLVTGSILFNAAALFAETPAYYIHVKPYSIVHGDDVLLGEIATIKVKNDNYRTFVENIRIAGSPLPSDSKTIKGRYILSKINRTAGLPDSVAIRVPETVMVKRDHQTVPEKTYKKLFYDYAEQINANKEFSVGKFSIRGDRPLPTGDLSFKTEPAGRNETMGRVRVLVNVFTEGALAAKVYVSAWVDVYDDVLCLARKVERGGIITADDVASETKNLSRIPDDYMQLKDDVVDMKADRSLRQGTVLRQRFISKPYTIAKGDRVQLKLQSGRLLIETAGVAENSGFRGDQIEVRTLDTGKVLLGKVVNSNTIEIVF